MKWQQNRIVSMLYKSIGKKYSTQQEGLLQISLHIRNYMYTRKRNKAKLLGFYMY